MIIKELYLKNFGKFNGTYCSLDEHMQVFYGENEYGKSTIYAFIKAMLFGMERGRGRAAGKDEFSRYEPWENPNYYAGEMRFVCGDRTFCLKRHFDRYGRNAVLYCEDDGEELSVEDGDLQMLLGGITLGAFENTAAIGQLTARPGQTLAEELKNYAANYYASGSSEVDLKCAVDTLKERKKTTEKAIKKCVETQKQELEKLQVAEQYMKNDMAKLQENAAQEKKKLLTLQESRRSESDCKHEQGEFLTEGKQSLTGAVSGGLPRAGVLLCILGTLLLTAGVLKNFTGNPWFYIIPWFVLPAGAAILAAGILCCLAERKYTRKKSGDSFRTSSGEDAKKAVAAQNEIERAEWELQRIYGQLTEKQIELGNIQEQKEELLVPGDAQRRLEERKEALELAMEHLTACASKMTEQFGERLNREASQILAEVTEGKYTRLFVGDNLQLSVFCGGNHISVEQLSRGTVEQIYFALRMAALNLLYEEKIPVIFDDAFGCYDEKRLKSTLKWLSNQDRQVIIFTCQRREQEIIEMLKRK